MVKYITFFTIIFIENPNLCQILETHFQNCGAIGVSPHVCRVSFKFKTLTKKQATKRTKK